MNLTLPQRLYLLSYTVDKGKFEAVDLQGRGQLLRAGALAELTFEGLLAAEDGKVLRRDIGSPPADTFLAEVWRDLPDEKPKNWLQYVHNKATTAEEPVRDQLAAAGLITLPENGPCRRSPPTRSPSTTRSRSSTCRRPSAVPWRPASTRRPLRQTSWPWPYSPCSAK